MNPSTIAELRAQRRAHRLEGTDWPPEGPEWCYGVTTVPKRIEDGTVLRTLYSLEQGGFGHPHLFIDGGVTGSLQFKAASVTMRTEPLGAFGAWFSAVWALYTLQPFAKRYAVLQDDLVVCYNLRQYLETIHLGGTQYWNLFTYPHNEGDQGFHESDQMGKGALALVFSNYVLRLLLRQPLMIQKPQDQRRPKKSIDGRIIEALKPLGIKEMVHSPGLVQHIGLESTINTVARDKETDQIIPRVCNSFVGEQFDALELVHE